MNGPLWETITVDVILVWMLIALWKIGDRLDHWTFKGQSFEQPAVFTVYGLTLKDIRKLRAFYINRTGDTKLENL